MNKILVFGAGSIGNHMVNASLKLKKKVFVTDKNPKAILRMKNYIFPKRYGKWDNRIGIINFNDVFKTEKEFDLIIIGTPPNTHLSLFKQVYLNIKYKKILIEKPISNFENIEINNFLARNNKKNNIFCGYNHSVNRSFQFFFKKFLKKKDKINFINVQWKENWNGILGAHPWLKDEFDSYLGSTKHGGGCLQEHSHGLHLLKVLLDKKKINLKKINFNKSLLFRKKGNKKYDNYCNINYFNQNIFFKYETDLLTWPAKKEIEVSGKDYRLYWLCNHRPNIDLVKELSNGKEKNFIFKKTRSQEFENEINHILKIRTKKQYEKSLLNLYNALSIKNIFKKILKK